MGTSDGHGALTSLVSPQSRVDGILHWLAERGVRGTRRLWDWRGPIVKLDEFTIAVAGYRLHIDYRGDVASAMYRGGYETAERRLAWDCLGPGGVGVDVGAHAGLFTSIMARRVGPSGRVIAVEPQPSMAARLRGAMPDRQVAVAEVALSDVSGEASIHNYPGYTEFATLRSVGIDGFDSVAVRTTTLTELIDSHSVRRVDFLKIDVEAWEGPVLLGAKPLFDAGRVGACLVEVSCDKTGVAQQVAEFVAALPSQYSCFALRHVQGLVRRKFALEPIDANWIRSQDAQFEGFITSRALRPQWLVRNPLTARSP